MDKFMEKADVMLSKVADAVGKQIEELAENPIKSGIKIFIMIWLVKKAYNLIKDA